MPSPRPLLHSPFIKRCSVIAAKQARFKRPRGWPGLPRLASTLTNSCHRSSSRFRHDDRVRSYTARRDVTVHLPTTANENDPMPGRVSVVPFNLMVWDGDLFSDFPVRATEQDVGAIVGNDRLNSKRVGWKRRSPYKIARAIVDAKVEAHVAHVVPRASQQTVDRSLSRLEERIRQILAPAR